MGQNHVTSIHTKIIEQLWMVLPNFAIRAFAPSSQRIAQKRPPRFAVRVLGKHGIGLLQIHRCLAQFAITKSKTWGLPKMGVPQHGWFMRKNPMKTDDDWGHPYFRKPPFVTEDGRDRFHT